MNQRKTKSFLTRVAVSFLVMLPCIAASGIAQTPTPAGNSTIHGRALYQDTERPIRRAPVVLISDEGSSQSRSTVTDGKGEFSFKNLPAGLYHILVDSPGYLNGFPHSDLRKRKATDVTVDGTSGAEIVVRAERGGAITGKITYPDGEPAVGAQINVFIKAGKRWSHAAFVSAGAETDDRGVYRIYPLQPGEYVLSVIERSMVIEEREGGSMQTVGNKSINPYFYADASTLNNARSIQVEAGREVNNINITLAERATYNVAGSVLGGGKPLAGAYLRLGPRDEGLSGPTSMKPHGIPARADKDGQWVFPDVPDGSYEVELDLTSNQFNESPIQDGAGRVRQKFIRQPLSVTVAGADVSGLVMSLSLGGRISGVILVEGDKPLPRAMDVVSALTGSDRSRYMAGGRVETQSKGAFLIEGVAAGENILRVNVWSGEYVVKSITWNSKDLLRQSLKVPEGGELKDIRIVLSPDVGRLSGRIISAADRKPLSLTALVLVPADETRWTRVDSFLSIYTDKQGAFKATGPPGEYILLLPSLRDNQIAPLDYVRTHALTGTRVTLKTGEPGNVDVVAPLP